MSLTLASNIAQSALSASTDLTSVGARNIARSGSEYAVRKVAQLVSVPDAGVRLAVLTRSFDANLYQQNLSVLAGSHRDDAIAENVKQLQVSMNGPDLQHTLSSRLSNFESALRTLSSSPSESSAARVVVSAADDVARWLNSATSAVQSVRETADGQMAQSVSRINQLLQSYSAVDSEIVKSIGFGQDVTDRQDQREGISRDLAKEIGLRAIQQPNGSVSLYTDSGLTLFETEPRIVQFEPTYTFSSGSNGNSVLVDGVPITGNSATFGAQTGRLVGLSEVRDGIAVVMQNQLDELARGLVEAFREQDQSAVSAQADKPGLFTFDGATGIPPSGAIVYGLAESIKIAATVDPEAGGNPSLIRDGGIWGPVDPAFVYNVAGASEYSDRINQLIDALGTSRDFDPASQLKTTTSLMSAASESAAWSSEMQKKTRDASEYQMILLSHSNEALSTKTGISLDDEMIKIMEFERSYQATSKLIAAVDRMIGSLISNLR